MRFLLLVTLAFALFLPSIQAQRDSLVTASGFGFVNCTHLPGPKISFGDRVRLHYKVMVGDSILSSTYQSKVPRKMLMPTQQQGLPKNALIIDALTLMTQGDSAVVYQVIDSTFRTHLPPGFEKETRARFFIKVLSVTTPADFEVQSAAIKAESARVSKQVEEILGKYKAGKLGKDLKQTASGLEYLLLEEGKGAQIKAGESLEMHYYGVLRSSGKMFDNSFDRGERQLITLVQMVPGFEEGLKLMRHGGKAVFFIPAALAYGDKPAGSIPPSSDLVFWVDIGL